LLFRAFSQFSDNSLFHFSFKHSCGSVNPVEENLLTANQWHFKAYREDKCQQKAPNEGERHNEGLRVSEVYPG